MCRVQQHAMTPPATPVACAISGMERRNRQARLTERASQGWDQFCTRHNISYTALMEALGEMLAEVLEADEGRAAPLTWVPDEAIERAKQLDRERHSRRDW